MRITVNQLRRIIKEEVRRVTEASSAPIGSAEYYSDVWRKKFKELGINPVFDGVDWTDPDVLSQYKDVDDDAKIPGYKKAQAAYKKAKMRMPSPLDQYVSSGGGGEAQLDITGASAYAKGLRMRSASSFCRYVKTTAADLGLDVSVGRFDAQLDGCTVTGPRDDLEQLATALEDVIAETMGDSLGTGPSLLDQIVDF